MAGAGGIAFVKMHGLGNDFVLLDHLDGAPAGLAEITPEIAAHLADRRLGVGCDQVAQLTPPELAGAHAQMRIFNADGSRAQMCGNAARCVGLYLRRRRGIQDETLILETLAGAVRIQDAGAGRFTVDMGPPEFDGARIPTTWSGPVTDQPLTIAGRAFRVTALAMGNPHCVIFDADVEGFALEAFGPAIECDAAFPERVNVEVVQPLDRNHLRMRVWERGVGITPACGTGACAAAVAAIQAGVVDSRVTVRLDGGDLEIEWRREENRVLMTGPAAEVFQGRLSLP